MSQSLKLVDNALQRVGVLLHKSYGFHFFLSSFNSGRHGLFFPPSDVLGVPSFYVLYKKEFFMSFNKVFSSFVAANPIFNSVGESINEDYLDLAVAKKVDYFLFVYDDGKVYSVPVLLVKKFCDKHGLRRVQEVRNVYNRRDGSGLCSSVNEITCSFPITLFKKWGELF